MTRESVGMWHPEKSKYVGEHLTCSFYHDGTHYRCDLYWRNTGDWEGYENQWVPWLEIRYTNEPMTMYGTFPGEKYTSGNIGGERHIRKRRMWKALATIASGITEEKIAMACK